MRRNIPCFFSFFVAGILLQGEANLLVAGAVITALFFALFIRRHVYMALFAILFVGIGYLDADFATSLFDQRYEYLKNANQYSGYVLDVDDNSLLIRNYKNGYKILVSFYSGTDAVPGDHIVFAARMSDKPDYKKRIMCSKGMDGYASAIGGDVRIMKNKNILMIPVRLRHRINSELVRIDPDGGSFVSGLVTGNIKELDENIVEDFQNLGISHILAVSGFNLGIIYFTIQRLATRTRLGARTRYILTLAVCLFYTAMGAFEPSVLRAFIMVFLAILAKLLNRYHDLLAGITLAAWTMLVLNPYYLYNVGFLLSFAATYGIVLLSRKIEDRVPERLSSLRGEISVSVAAFLATMPVMLWFRGFFSLITLFVNILIGPFTVIITQFAFVSTILYCIFGLKYFFYPVVFVALWFLKLMNFVSGFNYLVFTGAPSMIFIVLYYLLLAACFDLIAVPWGGNVKMAAVAAAIAVFSVTAIHGDCLLKIHYINVGQGESIFIETPDKQAILIDTGPSLEKFSALKKRIIPYIQRLGYNKLSAVIFTHFHNDHAGDYEYLLGNFTVDRSFCFETPPDSQFRFTEVSKGDRIIVGQVGFHILYPDQEGTRTELDKNEECLVIRMHYKGFSMLVPGDVEAKVLDGINGKFDVFNLSHHGSPKSFSPRMVDKSKIGIAVISVGKNNYGHPAPQVLDYLKKKNIKVYRTDRQGSITITTDGSTYRTLFQ